jgi:hypothetical protein
VIYPVEIEIRTFSNADGCFFSCNSPGLYTIEQRFKKNAPLNPADFSGLQRLPPVLEAILVTNQTLEEVLV